ncbi:uncharacterized protein LOC127597515 isoform X2 [Hippocampus zosterae]|uniref:uncharacterized protein LOC127597515 isoform X2 n=1 Tax=Hippocampus zosterae TaxID=109293 RepID=UPI00223D4BEE|nr:uncharacterized protein LOC127597515 isoform X2 [Hippocampus zosterae]
MAFSRIVAEPKPRGFISCRILQILPVLRLAEGEVKKADADPKRGPCEIAAKRTRTCGAMLNPGPAPSPSPLPAVRDADHSPSPPEALRATGSPQTGSEDQPIGRESPPRRQNSAEELNALNESHHPRVKSLGTPEAAAQPTATFASEQSVTEESPVGPAKSETTSTGETPAGAALATNQVLKKSDHPQAKTLQTRDVPAEPAESLACERGTLRPPKSEMGPGEADAQAKSLGAPGVPAELIVSFTSEQSVTGKRPVGPAPAKKPPPSAKRRRASLCPATAPLAKKRRRKLSRKHSNAGEEAKEASFQTPGLQNGRKPRQDDRQRLRKWAARGRRVRRLAAEALKAREAGPGNRTGRRAVGAERQAPPREKSERWNLKPVKSECGRVLVPHGYGRSARPAEETANVHGFLTAAAAALEPPGDTVGDLRDPVGSEAVDERGAPDGRPAKRPPTRVLPCRLEKPPNGAAETCLKETADLATELLRGDSIRPRVEPQGTPARFQQRAPKGPGGGEAPLEAQGQKAEILCRPLPIYPKWKRVKTLRKHLDISREHFKKTWWMHFRRPSGADRAVKERLRDDSLRKKTPSSNASTDALNLLADLALGADRPWQSERDVAGPPGSDLRKDVRPPNAAGAGEASLPLTPRGWPGATRRESPPAEGGDWARLLCQEHAYSLPLRASLPPALPGTPFQVSPLSGSTGLLQRPRAARAVETPRAAAADDLEELAEKRDGQPSDRGGTRTTALNRDRSFLCRDGSVQVTRQWKEKYDFGRDSRFSSDPKDRTIVRALHGPWDFSLQDTREDMQLIVHMWIGFFYSRSTARFIDLGSDRDTNPRSADGVRPEAAAATKARARLEADVFEERSERSLSNTSDLSGTSSLDGDSDVLTSSPRASNGFTVLPSDPQVHSAKASASADSPTEFKERQTFQGNRATILSAEIADQARRAVAPSPNETRIIRGEMATVSGETADRRRPKSDAGKMDFKGGSQAAGPTGLPKHERGSPLTKKETGGGSLLGLQTDARPLALVPNCEHSERGGATAPRRECFENRRAPTGVELQAAAFFGQGSASENMSVVNLEMAPLSPHGKESPCATTGALPLSGEEMAAPLAPIHGRPALVQHQTVKPLASDSELAEEGQKKVGVRRFSFFSGEGTKSTSGLEEVLRDRTRNGSPESIREPSTSRRAALKAGHIVGGTGSSRAREKPSAMVRSQRQKHFICRETVKLATEVGFVEEGQDVEVEGIHPRAVSPAGPGSAVQRPVRNRTEAGCLLGVASPKSVPERSPVLAEGRPDSGFSPIPVDDAPEALAPSGRQNDISSEGSDPSVQRWLDTKSRGPIGTTDATLGQPSNPSEAKDKGAKLTEPWDRSVVAMPTRRRADEDRRDAPTSGTKSRERKCRFYILVTSEDAFFAETKACLEAAGHTAVRPSQFFLGGESLSLLIIIRNQDISAHLSEVPHLLELKKSPQVRFAGIDEPHDVMNLTHQELFLSGGFVMFDGPSLEALSLDEVKRLMEVLQELNKTGKWKWLLHYRDSRRFKENARFTAEAEEKKDLLSWCQETGLCAVLPYHQCDTKSTDHPDYLACLVHSQVQNIAARFPVFVTDTRSAEQFEKNGILTATKDSFLTCFST